MRLPSSDNSDPGPTVQSSKDGSYSLSGLTLGNSYELTASFPGFTSFSSGEFLLDDSPKEMDFTLAKIKLADEQEAELSPDEMAEILAGARASIEKIRSGRIVYERDPIIPRHQDEDNYYSYVKTETENLRNKGWTDYQIQVEISEVKAEWEKRHDTGGNAHHEYAGEYIFEGNSSVHSVVTLSNPDRTETCYRYNNRIIVVETHFNGMTVTIHKGMTIPSMHLQSPLIDLKFVADMLRDQTRWIKPWIRETDGETGYSFERLQYPRDLYDSHLEIVPAKGHLTKNYGWISARGFARNIYFDNFRWSPEANLYYPTEITKAQEEQGVIGDMITLDFLEVEFNKDYDDTIFKPPLKEGAIIVDQRFSPTKKYVYNSSMSLDEFLADLDKKAKRLSTDDENPQGVR